MHIQQETSPIVPRGDIKGACGGFVGLMSTVFQTPIFLPGGLLVAKPGAGPSSFSGTDAKAAKPSPFVAECGVLSSSGRHGRTKSSSGDKSTVKPPHIGGKATTLLSAAKVPADASLRVNLASKELLDGDVIGSTKALLSVGSNGVSTNSRWAKTASKKAALLPGLNKQPLYEVSLDVQSGVDTSGGVSVKTGPLVYAPKLWGKREKIMSLASLFSLSSSSSLPLPLLQPRVPIERFLPTLARVLRVPNEKPYPTLLESDVSVSHNTASVNSTVKGFGGHGLHWAVSGGLKAGTGGKPASESNAADGRTPHAGPQRFSCEAKLMYLTTGLEAALKAACTPRQLTSTVSLFLSSQPAGIDVAVQVDAPLVKFGGVKAGSASSTIHPKLATRWKLSGCESLVASIGRDLKLAALYKWETSLPLSDSGTRQDRPRSEPSTQLPRTPVNIYGPVGAEAYADALFGIQKFRENNPMLSTALKRRRANNSRSGKDSSGEGEEEEGDNKHNKVTLLLGAELDVRAPTLLHKLGCTVNVKLAWPAPKLRVRLSNLLKTGSASSLACDRCDQRDVDLWLCLQCCTVLCGRSSKKHASKHAAKYSHAAVLSLSNRQLWCYECDMEILDEPSIPSSESVEAVTSDQEEETAESRDPTKTFSPLAKGLRAVLDVLNPPKVLPSTAARGAGEDSDDSGGDDGTPSASPRDDSVATTPERPNRGLCGLSNLGNTCFLNSVIQCLSNVPAFARGMSEVPIPPSLPPGSLPTEFADVMGSMWSGRYRSIQPVGVFRNLRKLNPMFEGYGQHDAQEALRYLLNELHEKMGVSAMEAGPMEPPPSPTRTSLRLSRPPVVAPPVYAPPPWLHAGPYTGPIKTQQSLISDIFRGRMCSSVRCKACGNVSITRDYFYDLSVPIPKKRVARSSSIATIAADGTKVVVDDEVAASSKPLTGANRYYCEHCKGKHDAEKSLSIADLPEVLCVHLKRFSFNSVWGSKVSTHVSFPLDGFDVSPWLEAPLPPTAPTLYDLAAISVHIGGMSGGHYIAYGRNAGNGNWYCFDDTDVSPSTGADVLAAQGYILFYTRRRVAPSLPPLPPPTEPHVYISRQWWLRVSTCAMPGPATAAPLLCDHGNAKASVLPHIRRLVVPISAMQWASLADQFGAGSPLSSLTPCAHCQEEEEALTERRASERERIVAIDALPPSADTSWYIISEPWLKKWRAFIDNAGPQDGTGRGVLPPPPIDNRSLLLPIRPAGGASGDVTFDPNRPLPNLKAAKHYRGINALVWAELSRNYGGGPEIKRSKLDLYSHPCVMEEEEEEEEEKGDDSD